MIESDNEFLDYVEKWTRGFMSGEAHDRLFALARCGAAAQWRPISEEDREWIDRRAYDLYQGWQRRMGSVRTQVIRPEDSICHWIMDATLERMIPLPPPPKENSNDH